MWNNAFMTSEAYIVDLVRTPMGRGKAGSSLSGVHPVDLGAAPVKALIERNKLDPKFIDDLIYGCVTPIAEQSMNIARLMLYLLWQRMFQVFKSIECAALACRQ